MGTVASLVQKYEALTDETLSRETVIADLKEITARPAAGQRRGQLTGLGLEQMTVEQLKVEKINANSVLYKAKQRGASDETIAKNQARVDAVNAEIAKRNPAPAAPADEAAPAETHDEQPQHGVETEV